MADYLISNNNFLHQRTCGNKDIDDFIRYTHSNRHGKMEFVPCDKFKDVEFIAEGGFSKIYKAIWIDGPRNWNAPIHYYTGEMTVTLKELNDSKNINSEELNELKIFHDYAISSTNETGHAYHGHFNYINKYLGITQHPATQNFMIITKYYELGNLTSYITNDFYSINWFDKLVTLYYIIDGLKNIHGANIIHKDYHSGNIFLTGNKTPITGDLGLSKSALSNNDNEIYGVIPYVDPVIFQEQKYTKASDIYSLGMIMWELMTGRRPFWDQIHDVNLIIKICNGFRPPIVTNAPEGYVELMQECWNFDPNRRPTASDLKLKVKMIWNNEIKNRHHQNPTKIIINSSDIGPVTANNPGAIYKSRPLSAMIKSAALINNLKGQNITLEDQLYYDQVYNSKSFNDKRKFDDNLTENDNRNDKKIRLFENGNNGYLTNDFDDVDMQI